MLNYVRSNVLGPLALRSARDRPQGIRRIESADPEFARALQQTIPSYTTADCLPALRVSIDLYRQLRTAYRNMQQKEDVEQAVLAYLAEIASGI